MARPIRADLTPWWPHTAVTRSGLRRSGHWSRLTVPQVRAAYDGRTIELAVFKLPGRPGGVPTLVLSGGPGQSAIEAYLLNDAATDQVDALRAAGDVIFLDQRGTGFSRPCLTTTVRRAVDPGRCLDRTVAAEIDACLVQGALSELQPDGRSIEGFNTRESAEDVEDLRQHLGAERINLFGISYGTHLALTVIRLHGDHVNGAVLGSVEGPDHTDKLPMHFERGLRDLADRMGQESRGVDLYGEIVAGIERLDRQPKIIGPVVGADPVVLTGTDLRLELSDTLGWPDRMAGLGRTVDNLRRDEWGWLAARSARWRRRHLENLVFYLMDVASGCSADRSTTIDDQRPETVLEDLANLPIPTLRRRGLLPVLDDEFRSRIISDVPVLFVSGSMDYRTPPENAAEIATGFVNGHLLTVDGAGHGRSLFTPVVYRAVSDFLRGHRDSLISRTSRPFAFRPADADVQLTA